MRITLEIDLEQIVGIARALNREAAGTDPHVFDLDRRNTVLSRIVGQAALFHNVRDPEVCDLIDRERAQFDRPQRARRLPKAKRTVN